MKPLAVVTLLVSFAALTGCSRDGDGPTMPSNSARATLSAVSRAEQGMPQTAGNAIADQDGSIVPADLRTIELSGSPFTFWPYTGVALDGVPSDPINVIFVGKASAREIRDALMSLDGDRSALGLPPVPPFNARWSDAIGDAQTAYVAGTGWIGVVVQLALGDYAPIRFHLRLFETAQHTPDGAAITLGAAHFEVLIPGTADHQVLSWEVAEQIVRGDLYRSGLLDAQLPLYPTAPINAAPGFRDIIPPIYNQLPPELIQIIGGPAPPQSQPVPIGTDGLATVFNLTGSADAAPLAPRQVLDLTYEQVVPRPFCSSGPGDFILVQGPVHLEKEVSVGEGGRLRIRSRVSGRLTGTPVDPTTNPPQVIGAPFSAEVHDLQTGWTDGAAASILADANRIAPQAGGTDFVMTRLQVTTGGPASFRARQKCTE